MKICWDNVKQLGIIDIPHNYNFRDLTNQKFGQLLVIKIVGKTQHNRYKWLCRCSCGIEKIIVGTNLVSGNTKSCGCLHKQMLSKIHFKNLIGKKFERLLVIKMMGKNKGGNYKWLCKCDCGIEVIIQSNKLISGNTKSCGCYNKEMHFKDLKGKKFGRLSVIKVVGQYNNNYTWLCTCDCGNEVVVVSASLINSNTQSCGCYNKERSSEVHSGEGNYLWKGGVSKAGIALYDTYAPQIEWCEEVRRDPDNYDYLQVRCKYTKCEGWFNPTIQEVRHRINAITNNGIGDLNFYCSTSCKTSCPIYGQRMYDKNNKPNNNRDPVYNEWAEMVKERDNYTCQRCGSPDRPEAHHMEGLNENDMMSLDLEMGITLCHEHHKDAHKELGCRYVDLQKQNVCK